MCSNLCDEMRISRNGTPTTCNVTLFLRRNSLLAYGENCLLFFLPILVGPKWPLSYPNFT